MTPANEGGITAPVGSTGNYDVATASPEIDDIRRKMAQIRRDLHEDVKGVVEGAEAATDWRRYVRSYPWALTGAALLVGYLIVPHRRHSTIQIAGEAPKAIAAEVQKVVVPEAKKKKGLIWTAIGMAVPLVLKAGQGYALQFAEQWLTQKLANQPLGNFADLAGGFGGGSPQSQPQGPQPGSPGAPRF